MANSVAKLHYSRLDIESETGDGTTVIPTIPATRVVIYNSAAQNNSEKAIDGDPNDSIAA